MSRAPDPIDMHVGARLRLRRMVLEMSQEHLASCIGVTFQQVQKYEKGQNRIGASRLLQLARALKAPVGYFFDGAPGGDSEAAGAGAPPVAALLATPDAVQLNLAFGRIADAGTRRKVLDLVQSLAGDAPVGK